MPFLIRQKEFEVLFVLDWNFSTESGASLHNFKLLMCRCSQIIFKMFGFS